MTPDDVFAGALITSAGDVEQVTPCYWVFSREFTPKAAERMPWNLVRGEKGLIIPWRHHWAAVQKAAQLVQTRAADATTVVACDCLPPGSGGQQLRIGNPQAVCTALFLIPPLAVGMSDPHHPGRDEIARLIMALYSGSAEPVMYQRGGFRHVAT